PSTNLVFTLVDASHNPGFDGIPGPATTAHLTTPTGLALAADGTLYIADFTLNTVFALSPAGVLTLIAGNGGCGAGGDGSAALSAQLCHPCDLALDERNGGRTLYVADFGNNRIRAIDLSLPSPQISTLTGAGGAPDPGDGDGGPASQASLVNPARISLGPDGMLYVADQGRNRIRRVNLTSLTIDNWIAGDSSFCRYNTCAVSWDAAGTAFLTRNISYNEFDVLRVGPNLSLTEVAGGFNQSSYAYGDGIPATQAHLWSPAPVRFDGAGNLILTETGLVSPGGHDLRRLSELTNHLSTLSGDGTPAYAGDYVDASQARFNSPWTSVLDASGNIYISDTANSAVRVIWGAGQSTPPTATLTKTAGDLQTVGVDQLTSTMTVQLHDGSGQPVVGFPVTWASLDPGAVAFAGTVATDNSGNASADGRVGLAVSSTFRFTATAYDFHGAPIAGSPLTFTHTSTELAKGTFFSIVNTAHTQGYAGIPGSATAALGPAPVALTYAADGTLYFATSDNIDTAIFALSPAGVVTRISGTTSCGYAGDTGPANVAQLCNITDLVLDETHQRRTLYFTDASNWVVRAIDLTANPPVIYRLAGGGSATTSPYGDGGLATEATIAHSEHITLDPTGAYLYVSSYDGSSTWIRRVNLSSGIIDTWIPPGAMPGGGASCAQSACKIAFGPDGTAVMSAGLGSYVFQLFSFDPAATPAPAYTHLAGIYDRFQYTGDGAATSQYFMPGDLKFGPDGKLYLTDPFSHRVRVLSDLTTSATMTTVAGYATQTGSNGADGPSAFVGLNQPHAVAFAPNGSIVIADTFNYTLREIWRAIP
ncbi:MAG: hypothetical protein JST92_00990, partial [Deltaproteobacteria bacterium]|nr:hypothetical protein [Deltaproteobacteria bacterium]